MTKVNAADVWLDTMQLARVLQQELEGRLATAANLSVPEFELLARLSTAEDQRMTMKGIADAILGSKSNVTKLVAKLEKQGLLTRHIPADNRRVVFAEITPAGLSSLGSACPALTTGLAGTLTEHLSAAELETMATTVAHLLEANGERQRRDALDLRAVEDASHAA